MDAVLRLLSVSLLASASCVRAWNTYVVPHVDGADDTLALASALASGNYSLNSTILFKKGVKYNILTPITFPKFTNVEVAIEGNLTYPESKSAIQAIVGASGFSGYWFSFSGGTNVTLRGTTDPKWDWVDGHGQQTNRPHGWGFKGVNGGVIKYMKLWQPIAWNFALSSSSNIHAYNNIIHAVSDKSTAFPFNTDGFGAGGTNLLFENNHIENGDDCLTVGSGGKNVTFRNSYCAGGHGLSIGSLGKGGQWRMCRIFDTIENIVTKSCLYGARFKSWTGGNGLARHITWKSIAFDDVPFPIYITQNYWDQGLGQAPNSTSLNNTHIQDFTFENFTGVIRDNPYKEGSCVTDPCWYAVTNATGTEVAIFDLYPGTATNIMAKNVLSRTQTGRPVTVMCDPQAISSDVGFKCWDGASVPTAKGL